MKNTIFSLADLPRRTALSVWLGLHILLIASGFITRPLLIDTSFLSILPVSGENPALIDVDTKIRGKMNSRIQILVGSDNFDTAKLTADELAGDIRRIDGIAAVDFETGGSNYQSIREFLHENRYRLLVESDRNLLRDGRGNEIAKQALREVFSPVSFPRLDYLDTDPFLLTDRILMSYLEAATGMNNGFILRDGVLTIETGDFVYVLISTELSTGNPGDKAIAPIREILDRYQGKYNGIEIVFNGFPFHNAESSSNAKREISIISMISLFVLTLVLIITFRSGVPWISSILMIVLAAAAAFSQTLLFFGRIHIFTLVFGTSLIGVTIDYSLHFFVARMQYGRRRGMTEVVRAILPGVLLGMLTTVVSYLALTFTSVPLLKQIAVFSIVGIGSSLLTVLMVFPLTGGGRNKRRDMLVTVIETFLARISGATGRRRSIMIVSVTTVVLLLAAGTINLQMDNNIRGFYNMSDELARNEMRFAEIADTESLSRYFVVLGDDEEDLLTREAKLSVELDRLVDDGTIDSWIGLSRFLPSSAIQEESRRLAAEHLVQLAGSQYNALGFDAATIKKFAGDVALQPGPAVSITDLMEQPFASGLENFWVGEAGGRVASQVFVFGYEDQALLKALEGADVFWYDSVEDISRSLQGVSTHALYLVGAAYLAIFAVLVLLRGFVAASRVCIIPLLAGLLGCGVIGWTKTPFNLFAVFGLILSLGIGIDYTIFLNERRKGAGVTYMAVALSCLSTLLSFGALSLSSFLPVADFGRMVLWGVLFSFLLSPLVLLKRGK